MNDDLLRESLIQISDQARPVDFLDRSLARSKRIGRNRALMAATAVVLTLALAGGVAWQFGLPGGGAVSPAESGSPSTTVDVFPPPSGEASVTGLSGWLFYVGYDRVFRLAPEGLVPVLVDGYQAVVSPDGSAIAYGDESGHLFVVDAGGGEPRALVADGFLAMVGFEPSWSADSRRLLVGRGGDGGQVELGVVDVAAGTFAALAHQPEAIHPLWSADGQRLVYATGTCRLGVADADGGNARLVPVFGELDASVNPQRRRSCDPFSVSPDGALVAVHQRVGDVPDGDIGRDGVANAVVDTRTGADLALPVAGEISAVLFLADGGVLVRSTVGSVTTLTLLNPDLTVDTQVTEPATVADTCAESGCSLLAYTPA